MYLLLTLFFSSLIGILIMIGRKLATVKNSEMLNIDSSGFSDFSHPFIPDLQKLKNFAIIILKKYGHFSIVTILRFHIRSTNFLKNKYRVVRDKIRSRSNENYPDEGPLPKTPVSNFLKTITDYKHKIKEIKHRIYEEEKKL